MAEPTGPEARKALAAALFKHVYVREWRAVEDAEQDLAVQRVAEHLDAAGFIILPRIPAGPRPTGEDD